DEPLERQPCQLAPDRIVARDDDHLGRVVDDQIHAGRRLDGADVPTLAADDATLHVVARQWYHRDGPLRHELPGDALDGDRDDLLGPPVGLLPALLLDLPDMAAGPRAF